MLVIVAWLGTPAVAQDIVGLGQRLKSYNSYHDGEINLMSRMNGSRNVQIPLIPSPRALERIHEAPSRQITRARSFQNFSPDARFFQLVLKYIFRCFSPLRTYL
jgi:hypothetical protein